MGNIGKPRISTERVDCHSREDVSQVGTRSGTGARTTHLQCPYPLRNRLCNSRSMGIFACVLCRAFLLPTFLEGAVLLRGRTVTARRGYFIVDWGHCARAGQGPQSVVAKRKVMGRCRVHRDAAPIRCSRAPRDRSPCGCPVDQKLVAAKSGGSARLPALVAPCWSQYIDAIVALTGNQ